MSEELAVQPKNEISAYVSPEAERFNMEQRMARLFVASGLFKDIAGTTQEMAIAQAWVKIAMGNSMGFSPAESMQGIDIIQGRPSVGAQLRASRLQRNGYSWSIDRLDATGCVLTIFAGGKELGKAEFLEEDAKRANLIAKDNWKKDPTSMYFARAITRAQRRYAPGVLSLDMMSREEIVDLGPEYVEAGNGSATAAMATADKTAGLRDELNKRTRAPYSRGPKPEEPASVAPQPPAEPTAEPTPQPSQELRGELGRALEPQGGGIPVESLTTAAAPTVTVAAPSTTRPVMPSTADVAWRKRTRETFSQYIAPHQYEQILKDLTGFRNEDGITVQNYKDVWSAMQPFKDATEILHKQKLAERAFGGGGSAGPPDAPLPPEPGKLF